MNFKLSKEIKTIFLRDRNIIQKIYNKLPILNVRCCNTHNPVSFIDAPFIPEKIMSKIELSSYSVYSVSDKQHTIYFTVYKSSTDMNIKSLLKKLSIRILVITQYAKLIWKT